MQTKIIRTIVRPGQFSFFSRRMCSQQGILQLHLKGKMISNREIGVSASRYAQFVITKILVAIDLAEGRADDEATIESLGKQSCV